MVLSVIVAANEFGRRPAITVRWATETEVDTLGFNLYRATMPEGQFQQINSYLILGAVDPLTGAEYEFVDWDVKPGRRYFYQLQEVEIDGTANRVELTGGVATGPRVWVLVLAGCGFLTGMFLAIRGFRRQSR
jgi:hypothetical protein